VHGGDTGNLLNKEESWDIRGNMAKDLRRIPGFWGDTGFLDKVLGQKRERSKRPVMVEEIVSHVCRRFSVREELLPRSGKDRSLTKVRAIAAWWVLESGRLTLAELSDRVHRDSSTLSTAPKVLEQEAQTDRDLNRLMNKIREDLFEIQISKA